jgi:SpoVK/Ycf46/Vps4 family AAA+-type ATPase
LYQFASIVAKADGTVTTSEEEVLKLIMKFPNTTQGQNKKITIPPAQTLEEVLKELNDLIGLADVKAQVNSLVNYIKIQKAREAAGLKTTPVSYHMVFTGNPGTGKTTVARIVSKIYKALGINTGGQLVETDRSGLVAEYVGQTAIKVNKVVDLALEGVLFIDEAYAIAGDDYNDYGKEAIATLIKRMEDERHRLILILAGYTDEMETFIDSNPGFKLRFNRYIQFSDYTPDEMMAIYELHCTRLQYQLLPKAKSKLFSLLKEAHKEKDRSFGNGRFVRNIFEKTLEKQADRLATIVPLNVDTLTKISMEDIPQHSA